MAERYRPKTKKETVSKKDDDYFEASPVEFIKTGCTLLDCIMGGGWALGRCVNIVGDESTGKTLLAQEACTNFALAYPKGKIWYREAEAAFDLSYARALGTPVDRIDFGPDGIDTQWDTIEDIFEDLDRVLKEQEQSEKKVNGLYVVDSLDALTSRAALERKPGEGSYNLEKPKALSELFSKLVRRLRRAGICLMIISQLRDKIGLGFGEKKTRSGGRALNYYASQIVWLSHIKTLKQTIGGVERATMIQIKARCKKNKVGQPMRDCTFFIQFGFGVDDLEAGLDFLDDAEALGTVQEGLTSKGVAKFIKDTEALPEPEYLAKLQAVQQAVRDNWNRIEEGFLPKRSKYGSMFGKELQ